MLQRKYHLVIILKNNEMRFFEGFYRDSSIGYWTRYKNNFQKNNPLSKIEIFPSEDKTKVDKFMVTNINGEKYILLSDKTLKKEYPKIIAG